jgi:hypothetical protein
LLTGVPPFTREELQKIGEEEMRRIIREVEPTKPSKKLSSSEELPVIALNRHLEPKKLTRLVQGDLDCVVMKCLEKGRERRYPTAVELADDLARWLRGDPVHAQPPTWGYLAGKYLHRRWKATATIAAQLLMIVALLVGLFVYYESRLGVGDQGPIAKGPSEPNDQDPNASLQRLLIGKWLGEDEDVKFVEFFADGTFDIGSRAVQMDFKTKIAIESVAKASGQYRLLEGARIELKEKPPGMPADVAVFRVIIEGNKLSLLKEDGRVVRLKKNS